ncbi:MAG: [FeFe] hydrogenase H-cluster radical SAM maturase HydE, partial [Bacteroidales bacterium]
MKTLIDQLYLHQQLSKEEFVYLINQHTPEESEYLFEKARAIRQKYYGVDVYMRGLIEFTNYCKNDCFYCGIRRSNQELSRYHLTK